MTHFSFSLYSFFFYENCNLGRACTSVSEDSKLHRTAPFLNRTEVLCAKANLLISSRIIFWYQEQKARVFSPQLPNQITHSTSLFSPKLLSFIGFIFFLSEILFLSPRCLSWRFENWKHFLPFPALFSPLWY